VMVKKARAKKGKSSGRWQRTIIGISLALIMIGSVITAMTYL